ncbi:MAG TPA: MarR family winged helix-turn-helix transcriptional regulator [Gemmatimonadales bacterium]|jgi:DNA-binding MarR family transcriptional regulator|nr:MarR family winged helix-turn-helix transcriptional regulator [Gemmatimonadales bacterium]
MLTNISGTTRAQEGGDTVPLQKPTGRNLRPPRLNPTEQAADRLHSAAIHLLRTLRREDARLGVGPAGLSVLSVLVFGGPKTIGELAAIEQVKRPTMTRIVASLERWGMVQRDGDARDRRRVVIHPTPTGRVVMRRGRMNRVYELAARMTHLTPEEITLLARAAELIERVLKT